MCRLIKQIWIAKKSRIRSIYADNQPLLTRVNILGAVSIRKTVLPGMAIPMLKIRRPNGRLIFTWKSPYVDKTVFILRRGPGHKSANIIIKNASLIPSSLQFLFYLHRWFPVTRILTIQSGASPRQTAEYIHASGIATSND